MHMLVNVLKKLICLVTFYCELKEVLNMVLNFCPNCGEELKDNPKFCPNCGNKLINDNEESTENIANNEDNERKINVNAPAPSRIGYGNDIKSDRIIAYKRAMGLESTADNVVAAQTANMGRIMLSPLYASLTQKWFVLSFEKDGILFIGLNTLSHFTGKNMFVPKESITDLEYRTGLLRKVFSFKLDGRKMKYYLPITILTADFQHANMAKLDSLVSQYE